MYIVSHVHVVRLLVSRAQRAAKEAKETQVLPALVS